VVLAAAVGAAPAGAHAPAEARGGRVVAAAEELGQTIAARQRFFGAENVDSRTGAVRADRAIFTWVGVAQFAVALRGHVLLLDAWVPRGAHSGYVPTSPDELARLDPEAIFIGHSHFDHAADAVPIAQASGATLVGSAEHCAEFAERAPTGLPPRCVEAMPAGAAPGVTTEVGVLEDIAVTAVKHLHSAATAPDDDDSGGYHVPVTPLPSTTLVDDPPTPADIAHAVQHAPDAEGGSLLYRFRAAGTSFVWHDTSGPLADHAPRTFDAFRALRPVDVQLGSIQGFNQITNGMRDPRMYIEAIAPTTFVPTHHDDWLIGITTRGSAYRQPFETELRRLPPEQRPRVRFITDPLDYLEPRLLTFPLRLEDPVLRRRCAGRGRLQASLGGELDGVRGVRYDLGGRRARRVTAPPFFATYGRRDIARARGRRLRAVITRLDGTQLTLTRKLPRCR
jgi:L-ascorbate metabolism protein UlaG (beta-lactamase superfamily)